MRKQICMVMPISRNKDYREIQDAINEQLSAGWNLFWILPAESGATNDRIVFVRRR